LKSDEAFFSLFSILEKVLTRLFEKRGNSSDMQTTAAPSLPISSFTIGRYHVKFMPSFDIITSTGWDSSKQSSGNIYFKLVISMLD
jgi:hypothetical protein